LTNQQLLAITISQAPQEVVKEKTMYESFTIEDASRLIDGEVDAVINELDAVPAFQAVLPPIELRAALHDLAQNFIEGRVLMTDVTASLKHWAGILKSRGQSTNLQSLQQDFNGLIVQLREQAKLEKQNQLTEKPRVSGDQLERAKDLGRGDILAQFKQALHDQGYIADEYTARALLHTIYARLLNSKSGWLFHGRSRSGKSKGLECAFELLHPSNRMRATSMTTGAIYGLGHLDHLFILGGELRALKPGEDDQTQQVLRQFLSEKELTHHRLEEKGNGQGGYERTEHTVTGFASIAWTSTKDPVEFKDEFALRLTSVPANDSSNVTSEVMLLAAARAKAPTKSRNIERAAIERFQNFDLSLEPLDVIIPYAEYIVLKNTDTTARGIFEILLAHIRISALYNQHKIDRNRDEHGCIIATVEDYKSAHELVTKGAFKIFDPVSPGAKEVYGTASKHFEEKTFSMKELVDATQRPRSTLQGYMAQLKEADMVEEFFDGRSKRFKLLGSIIESSYLGLVPTTELISSLSKSLPTLDSVIRQASIPLAVTKRTAPNVISSDSAIDDLGRTAEYADINSAASMQAGLPLRLIDIDAGQNVDELDW
jgi:DNA-binding transcriptional ArsR family regulator